MSPAELETFCAVADREIGLLLAHRALRIERGEPIGDVEQKALLAHVEWIRVAADSIGLNSDDAKWFAWNETWSRVADAAIFESRRRRRR